MTALEGPTRVHIVGAGLLGTSIGLGLREHGVDVTLEDASPNRVDLAVEYGAGHEGPPTEPVDVVVVATPPDVTAAVVAQALSDHPSAVVTDVASVKGPIVSAVATSTADASRFVPGHPMAGRERGGPTQARVDLFTGRPWVLCPSPDTPSSAIGLVSWVIGLLGATIHTLSPEDHDRAVALVSHLPQILSSSLASQLIDAPEQALALSGQALRDMTRVAQSDQELWSQILAFNAEAVTDILHSLQQTLGSWSDALATAHNSHAKRGLAEGIERGAHGVARLPGKHGGSSRFSSLVVIIDDRPGQLATLFGDVGELGVNLEDMSLEHSPGAPVGFVELWVVPDALDRLAEDLTKRNWRIAGEGT